MSLGFKPVSSANQISDTSNHNATQSFSVSVMMKMTYRIVMQKGAGGSSFGPRKYPHTDADGKLVVFQTYEEAVQKCEQMNSKLVDRNLRYFVERRPITT